MDASSALPLEILLEITQYIDSKADLLALRLTSHSLKSLVTPRVFRRVTFTSTDDGADALIQLQNDDLSTYVAELWFDGEVVDGSPGNSREVVRAAFSGLSEFPALKSLHISFTPLYKESRDPNAAPSDSLLLQWAVLKSISENPPPPSLLHISLHNLIARPHGVYTSDAFRNLLRPIKCLSVSVISNTHYEGSWWDFWGKTIPHILQSPAESLESLTLTSDQYVGSEVSGLNLDGLSFPHLACLSLTSVMYDSAEAFILRHKSTLTHLRLVDCPMYNGMDADMYLYNDIMGGTVQLSPTRLWSDAFARLEMEMTQLVLFVLGRYEGGTRTAAAVYRLLDRYQGYVDLRGTLEAEREADERALASLEATVEARMQKLRI